MRNRSEMECLRQEDAGNHTLRVNVTAGHVALVILQEPHLEEVGLVI